MELHQEDIEKKATLLMAIPNYIEEVQLIADVKSVLPELECHSLILFENAEVLYKVKSLSKHGDFHGVALFAEDSDEFDVCSCFAFMRRGRPCHHLFAAQIYFSKNSASSPIKSVVGAHSLQASPDSSSDSPPFKMSRAENGDSLSTPKKVENENFDFEIDFDVVEGVEDEEVELEVEKEKKIISKRSRRSEI
jgi:hypothetical protein